MTWHISSTYFPHKRIHKATWSSPGGTTTNQIDHILIDRRHGCDITDVRSCHGADCDSDHYMVRVNYKQKIANMRKIGGRKQKKYVSILKKDMQVAKRYSDSIQEKISEIVQ
jgi:hypothetical protein